LKRSRKGQRLERNKKTSKTKVFGSCGFFKTKVFEKATLDLMENRSFERFSGAFFETNRVLKKAQFPE
jgi:hypothetical protein